MATIYDALRALRSTGVLSADVENVLTRLALETPPATPREARDLIEIMATLDQEESRIARKALSETMDDWEGNSRRATGMALELLNDADRLDTFLGRSTVDAVRGGDGKLAARALVARASGNPALAGALIAYGAKRRVKAVRKTKHRKGAGERR